MLEGSGGDADRTTLVLGGSSRFKINCKNNSLSMEYGCESSKVSCTIPPVCWGRSWGRKRWHALSIG